MSFNLGSIGFARNTFRVFQPITLGMALLAAASLSLAGCAGSPSGESGSSYSNPFANGATAPIVPISMVYSISYDQKSVVGYPVTAHGTVAATISIPLNVDIQAGSAGAIATDSFGQIYASAISQTGVPEVFTYASGATTPGRVLYLQGTLRSSFMAVDGSGFLYVATQVTAPQALPPTIQVYASSASGNDLPVRTITLQGPYGALQDMEVGAAGDLCITYNTVIDIFPAGTSGVATPARAISTYEFYGAAMDSTGAIYAVYPYANSPTSEPNSLWGIAKFGPGTTGSPTPASTLNLAPNLPAGAYLNGGQVRLDSAGNMYVALNDPTDDPASSMTSQTTSTAIMGFPITATGNATPASSFSPMGLGNPIFSAH